ncbi:PD-(D/E)XK nuclease family protein [Azospirillum sp. SYSU D00513]|uniref:PD-(D/E)XK nuclease family protein n=1 Tax=Azospirillum sp. SYSU D00513 TaxID=2812561 RepID=UPI001A96233D|nr:PD-(D/E)XK nuclease family protein [Azospirillum sp. SYSU D00513]
MRVGWKERWQAIRGQLAHRAWLYLEGLPQELRTASLLLSEQEIRTHLPVPLHGIPDQVFLTAEGLMVVVDTKTRPLARVRFSDVVQLSTYALILASTTDPRLAHRRVAAHGYVRLVSGVDVRYERVALLPAAEVVGIWCDYWRRQELRSRASEKAA